MIRIIMYQGFSHFLTGSFEHVAFEMLVEAWGAQPAGK